VLLVRSTTLTSQPHIVRRAYWDLDAENDCPVRVRPYHILDYDWSSWEFRTISVGIPSDAFIIEICGELHACIDLDTERREKENDVSYIIDNSVLQQPR